MSDKSASPERGKFKMADISHNPVYIWECEASGFIHLHADTIERIRNHDADQGDVITLSEIAGMQAAKRTAELIPLCHPRQLTHIDVKALVFNNGIEIKSLVKTMGQTGGDMEALTAVSVGLLTVYDLCRNTDKGLIINDLKLLRKTSIAI